MAQKKSASRAWCFLLEPNLPSVLVEVRRIAGLVEVRRRKVRRQDLPGRGASNPAAAVEDSLPLPHSLLVPFEWSTHSSIFPCGIAGSQRDPALTL